MSNFNFFQKTGAVFQWVADCIKNFPHEYFKKTEEEKAADEFAKQNQRAEWQEVQTKWRKATDVEYTIVKDEESVKEAVNHS